MNDASPPPSSKTSGVPAPQGGTPIVSVPGEALDRAAAQVIEKTIGATADGVISTAGNIAGGLLGDAIRDWRNRRLFDRAAETAEMLKRRGVDLEKVKTLPMGEVYALFDGATKEDDPGLASMWSALLANALDPAMDITVSKDIVGVLQQLTPKDAAVLEFIRYYHEREAQRRVQTPDGFRDVTADIDIAEDSEQQGSAAVEAAKADIMARYKELGLDDDEHRTVAVNNLIRLSCLQSGRDPASFIPRPVPKPVAMPFFGDDRGSYPIGLARYGAKPEDPIDDLKEAVRKAIGSLSPSAEGQSILLDVNAYTGVLTLKYDFSPFSRRLIEACAQ